MILLHYAMHVNLFQGQPFSRAHFKTSKCPPIAALLQVHSFQGQPFSRAHFKTRKWPPIAALLQVYSFQGQPFSRAHFKTSIWPPCAALSTSHTHSKGNHSREPISRLLYGHPLLHYRQVHSSQGQPFSRAHFKTSKCPPCAALLTSPLIPSTTIQASPFQDF